MLSGPAQVKNPGETGGQPVSVPDQVNQSVKSSTKTQPSTMFALGEGAKVFGRVAYKVPYIWGIFCFEVPSLLTECLTGAVGAAVGIMVGSTAILARKCMGVTARKFFGLENPRKLSDYVVAAHETGALLGELPGKFVGGMALFTYACSLVVSSSTMIPLTLIATAVPASTYCAVTIVSTKRHGECCFADASLNIIQYFRTWFQKAHDDLQGIRRPAMTLWRSGTANLPGPPVFCLSVLAGSIERTPLPECCHSQSASCPWCTKMM